MTYRYFPDDGCDKRVSAKDIQSCVGSAEKRLLGASRGMRTGILTSEVRM